MSMLPTRSRLPHPTQFNQIKNIYFMYSI